MATEPNSGNRPTGSTGQFSPPSHARLIIQFTGRRRRVPHPAGRKGDLLMKPFEGTPPTG